MSLVGKQSQKPEGAEASAISYHQAQREPGLSQKCCPSSSWMPFSP